MKTRLAALASMLTVVSAQGLLRPQSVCAQAVIPVPGTSLSVGWSVSVNPVTDDFDYRYFIKNNGAMNLVDDVRWTLAEDQQFGHAGAHDEGNFMNDGGVYQYDRALGGFPPDNYDWRNLDIQAGATISLGFSDSHGPTMERWRAEQGANFFDSLPGMAIGAPVPRFGAAAAGPQGGLGEIRLPLGGGQVKAYRLRGSAAIPAADVACPNGIKWNYKYYLKNTGNVPIGPDLNPPNDNHADFYVNEHPTHRAPPAHKDEAFNQPDNAYATAFGWDSNGHVAGHPFGGGGLPPGIGNHNYYWEGLGDGAAAGAAGWLPGANLTLGFSDCHGPGLTNWNGWVVGSEATGSFNSHDEQVVVPAVPEPTSIACVIVTVALTAHKRKRERGIRS